MRKKTEKNMSKFILFMIVLMTSSITLADGGIPLLLLFGSNFFVTGILPPFLGLLLFWVVCKVEENYFIEIFGEREKFGKYVPRANIYSTLWGIPLTICLVILGEVMPCLGGDCNRLMTGLFGPAYNLFGRLPVPISFIMGILLYLVIFIWESWLVEYRYLRKKLNLKDLKKHVFIANIRSYLCMGCIYVILGSIYMLILFLDKLL